MISNPITEIRNEGGSTDVLGNAIPATTVIGVYDAVSATRNTYYAHDYAALQTAIGTTQAATLAAQAGWTV